MARFSKIEVLAAMKETGMVSLSSYISLFTTTLICIGAVFELPILVFLLSRFGILKREFMRKYRRHVRTVRFRSMFRAMPNSLP